MDYSEEVISDQLIRGINDKEILSDLLGEAKSDITLQEVVDYIARKKQAKTEQGKVSYDQSNSVLHSPKRDSSCWACHGNLMDQTQSRQGEISAQLGSPTVVSVRARVTIPQPVLGALSVEVGDTEAAGATGALRRQNRRSPPCRPVYVQL